MMRVIYILSPISIIAFVLLIIFLRKRSNDTFDFLNKLLLLAGVAGIINTILFLLISKYQRGFGGGNEWQTPETILKAAYYVTNSILVILAALKLKHKNKSGLKFLWFAFVLVMISLFVGESGGIVFFSDSLFLQTLWISAFGAFYGFIPPLGTLSFLGGLFSNVLAIKKWRERLWYFNENKNVPQQIIEGKTK